MGSTERQARTDLGVNFYLHLQCDFHWLFFPWGLSFPISKESVGLIHYLSDFKNTAASSLSKLNLPTNEVNTMLLPHYDIK